jgi:DNA-binding HxlR family transcriptional regulator
MVERIDPAILPGRPCSLAAALELIGDRWSLLVVREVSFGNRRFSQIARNTGAPRDRLAARLRSLVVDGILERRTYQESPHREEYHLTDAGRDLAGVITALLSWGDKWAVTAPPMRLRHKDHVLEPVTWCAACGERVHRDDVTRESLVDDWAVVAP